uniref:Immunodominant membrane protein n=1 Tax=Candidatus Phytoplasma phoenicium TaxID=198422 RepID=A0A7L8YQZ3_9MOLU|nr:immunodominant membrane protein [Candidatus Phytoplasma phoenicium]QOI32726.1 immunodominant membrane protein [Candidatus Phytoplasma phoenicium]
MQKENLLNTTKGKVIVGIGSTVALILVYALIAYFFSIWPFTGYTKAEVEKLSDFTLDAVSNTDLNEKDKANKKYNELQGRYEKIEKAAKSTKVSEKDDTKNALEALKNKLTDFKNKINQDTYTVSEVVTACNAVTKSLFTAATNAIIKDADLK